MTEVIVALILIAAIVLVILWRTNHRLREIRDAAKEWRDQMAPRTGIDPPAYGRKEK